MIQEYLDEMKEIHQAFLDFIDETDIYDRISKKFGIGWSLLT